VHRRAAGGVRPDAPPLGGRVAGGRRRDRPAVERCPTGALAYTRTDGAPAEALPDAPEVRVARDGPLYVRGPARVAGERAGGVDPDRTAVGRFALCRCGRTGHAPFCDNSHRELPRGWGSAAGPAPGAPAAAPPATPNVRAAR
jgi:hypothetical protein